MNILFVFSKRVWSSKYPLETMTEMQFGVSYISSLLKQHGHKTRLIILSKFSEKINKNRIKKIFTEFSPDLICFTAVSTEFPFICTIADSIKHEYPNILRVIGGPHASINPAETLKNNFDIVCVGEGEYPMLELVTALEKGENHHLYHFIAYLLIIHAQMHLLLFFLILRT